MEFGYNFVETSTSKLFPMKQLIINVGRQFGSGGKDVALEIGKILGINVYDNELIIKAAQKSGFSSEIFTQNDEKKTLFQMGAFVTNSLLGIADNYVGENEIFRVQSEAIKDIADKESAVIIGRCSDYILRDRGNTLDVFITSPMKERVKRIAKRMNLNDKDAENLILKKDKGRESYYNYFTFCNWGVADNYDLCVDSSILGIRGTAELIVDFLRRQGRI